MEDLLEDGAVSDQVAESSQTCSSHLLRFIKQSQSEAGKQTRDPAVLDMRYVCVIGRNIYSTQDSPDDDLIIGKAKLLFWMADIAKELHEKGDSC